MQFQQPASAVKHQPVRVVTSTELAIVLGEHVVASRQAQPRILEGELARPGATEFGPLGHIISTGKIDQIYGPGHTLLRLAFSKLLSLNS
jgi:hypothetical protein